MKKKRDTIYIYSDLYKVTYWISYGMSEKKFKDKAKSYFNHVFKEEEDITSCAGRCTVFDNKHEGRVIWIWTRYKDVTVLIHELFHAVFFTLENLTKLSIDTDEIYAYLIQWLFEKFLDKNKR